MGSKIRPEEIKNVVQAVIGQLAAGASSGESGEELYRIVAGALTEKEGQHARVSGRGGRAVFITVDSPVLMFQLNLKRQRILQKIQDSYPEIKKVHFKIGKAI